MGGFIRAEAERRELACIDSFGEIELRAEAYDEGKIIGLVNRFAQRYGDGLVLYGGITATARIYGLKRIRDTTSDLDFACTLRGLEALLADDGRPGQGLLYHTRFDILFTVADNVPISFSFGHIHDWPLDAAFFASTLSMSPFGIPLRCCSREHTIMLKLRRLDARLAGGEKGFGKDALDILNILAAEGCGANGAPPGRLDIDALCELIRKSVTEDGKRLGAALAFIRGYEGHLTAAERAAIAPLLGAIAGALGI
jgi:hypothetical protein